MSGPRSLSPWRWAAVAVLVLAGLSPALEGDDLQDAFHLLRDGRAYLAGFPNARTRKQVVDDFLGANGLNPNRPLLLEAVSRAVAIRRNEPPDPVSFPSGQPPRSLQARTIAWESLEALGTGYLFAGNRDLLAATRFSYPGANAANDTRGLPAEEPAAFGGTSQKQATYARLYFLQVMKDVLEFTAEDPTGALRAGSGAYPTVPHYVKFDDELSTTLPWGQFDDPNFGGPGVVNGEASQSVAFLHGSAMERLNLASVAYADRLWRGAYAGQDAGVKRLEEEKGRMLQRAADVLRENVHAEFLGVLPLAAQLSDGGDGAANEFRQAKLDQARVSVTSALRLREQILSGEKPTQAVLVSAWDPSAIEQQISRCRAAYEAARLKWEGSGPQPEGSVSWEITRDEQALSQNADRQIALRNNLESQLVEITGIDPALFEGLRSEAQRVAYTNAVQEKFDRLLNAQDPDALELRDGSLMSVQALRIIQAIREAQARKASIDSYPQRIRVELERNNDVNATVSVYGTKIGLLDYATHLANAYTVAICSCGANSGVTTTEFLGSYTAAINAILKAGWQSEETVAINTINSAATIRNLLIEQQLAVEELPVIALNASIAGAELRHLLAKAKRLVEDHIFYQDITDTLWYRDPSLAFKLERAEEEYQVLMQEFRIELYKLARMLEAAWTERFQNPVRQGNGTTIEPLGNNGAFDDFTEAESVFSLPNHVRGQEFWNALKAWDLRLRDPLYRGPHNTGLWDVNTFTGQPISLRRDIFKLIDYRYDFAGNRYEVDPALTRQTIQQFRAILLNLAARDPANANGLTRLRIDFPLTYNQSRAILGLDRTVPIVLQNRPAGTFDQFWNHRVKEIGIKIVGKNVFASGATVPVSLELFGNVDRIGFFPDSLFTFSRTITSFPVPLYQRDPDRRFVGEPFFGTAVGIPAAIGSTPVPPNQVSGWPLFCDNIVLRIGSQGTLRIENIDDIEFYLKMEVGSPPPFASGIW